MQRWIRNSLKLAQEEGGPSAEGEGDDEGGEMNGDDTRTRKSNVKNLLFYLPVVCRKSNVSVCKLDGNGKRIMNDETFNTAS